jgi:protein-L-isoaspartate(D-aspartate) O-methyltransferase
MCELLALRGDETVLDVGTGSGYHAALLARLARHVYSVERHEELSERAARSLAAAGVDNVTLAVGDGSLGLPEHAPYDAINVAAAAAGDVPPALGEQLATGGRLVAPVSNGGQRLVLLRRSAGGLSATVLERVRFVPLVGG